MKYDPATFTYGMELEWGDVVKSLPIPEHLGKWEYSETDIINTREPYKFVAADPLGIDPPVGGEINTMPTRTWQEQVDIVAELDKYFADAGCPPSYSFMSHTHVHVHVPGLIDDIAALKRLMRYIKRNQHDAVQLTLDYQESPELLECPGAKRYFKHDGGRLMPEWMCDNIINLATDFNSFIKLHAAGKDGVSMGRPFRYAINTYCLKHTKTVEFRHFRHEWCDVELESIFKYVTAFLDAALNGGPYVVDILAAGDYTFPEMVFDPVAYMGWHDTKHGKDRGKKERHYVEVV